MTNVQMKRDSMSGVWKRLAPALTVTARPARAVYCLPSSCTAASLMVWISNGNLPLSAPTIVSLVYYSSRIGVICLAQISYILG